MSIGDEASRTGAQGFNRLSIAMLVRNNRIDNSWGQMFEAGGQSLHFNRPWMKGHKDQNGILPLGLE
jgi:hypothetical protein